MRAAELVPFSGEGRLLLLVSFCRKGLAAQILLETRVIPWGRGNCVVFGAASVETEPVVRPLARSVALVAVIIALRH